MKKAKWLIGVAAVGVVLGEYRVGYAADVHQNITVSAPNFSYDSADHPEVTGATQIKLGNSLDGVDGGTYTVKLNIPHSNDALTTLYKPGYWAHCMERWGAGNFRFSDVNLDVSGNGVYKVRPMAFGVGTFDFENVNLKIDVRNFENDQDLEVTGVRVADAVVNIKNLHLDSSVDFRQSPNAAHNGVYSLVEGGPGTSSVLNLTGNVYINTNIPGGAQEAYDGEYGAGVAKNDAVSGKYGGVVNINVKPGTTEILDPSNVIQILGNIDVKDGAVNAALSGADSFWYGSEVGGVEYDKTTHTYGDLRPTSRLSLSLADGAQWVPDIMPIGDGGAGDSRAAVISAITLHRGGIVNMHGLNKHTDAALTVNELTIYNLTTDGGVFRIDASGEKTDAAHRNGTDFVKIKAGSGAAYVQPLDSAKLEGVGADNPVQFADAAAGVTFAALPETSGIEEGVLYDYEPIIAADYTGDASAFGRNWYFVDVKRHETPTADTAIAQAALDYAVATARLEIDSLNKRLGELRDYDAPEGFWFRYKRGEMEGDGAYFKDKYNFYQLGWDRKRETDRRGVWRYGLAAHYGDNSADYAKGSGSIDSFGASVYAGWTGKLGHYADFVLKYSHLDNDFTVYAPDGTAKGGYNNWAMSVSAEYGYKFDLGRRWILEPQSQLVYTHIFDASYATSNGIEAKQDGVDSLIGRLGFRLGREFGEKGQGGYGKWYVKADLLHEFCGDREVNLYGAHGQMLHKYEDGGDTWFAAGIGADVTMGKNSFFYCDVEKSFGADIETNWQVNLGVRWEF